MNPQPHVLYECTNETFQPRMPHPVRWLDWYEDYELARTMWPESLPLTRETWLEARELGYTYCGAIAGGEIEAIAAVWRYSETAWDVAAVRTRTESRRCGYARSVVSFVTAYILASGRLATCSTNRDNLAMQRTAESVGFHGRPSSTTSGPHAAS